MSPTLIDSRVTALCSDCFTHEVPVCSDCRVPHSCRGHACADAA